MFSKIKEFFAGKQALTASLNADKDGAAANRDLHVAAAVLLIEMAGADKGVDQKEAETICAMLAREFSIPDSDIPELVQTAIAARKDKGKIDEFVKAINEHFQVRQRQTLLAMIWKVVLADGKIEKFEERLAVQMRFRFQLSEEQANEARAMAEQGEV